MTAAEIQALTTDVAILGAGPAGLAAAAACQDAGLACLVLDKRGLASSFVEYPHSLRFFSPPEEMEIADIPLPVAGGHQPTREIYLSYLRGVARARRLPVATWESVLKIEKKEDDCFILHTRNEPNEMQGRRITAAAIILATGMWNQPLNLGVEGNDLPHVQPRIFEPTPYYGHSVLVVGGGNSAVGGALSLMQARAQVSLCMRRPPKNYRSGLRPFVKRDLAFAVQEKRISLYDSTVVTKIMPDRAVLRPVRYMGSEDLSEGSMADYVPTGEAFEVPARFVFTLIGHKPDVEFFRNILGLQLRPDGRPLCDSGTWETSVPGVFLAGSLADAAVDIVLRIRNQSREVVDTIRQRIG